MVANASLLLLRFLELLEQSLKALGKRRQLRIEAVEGEVDGLQDQILETPRQGGREYRSPGERVRGEADLASLDIRSMQSSRHLLE